MFMLAICQQTIVAAISTFVDFVATRLRNAHGGRRNVHWTRRTSLARASSFIRLSDLAATAISLTRRASKLDFEVSQMTRRWRLKSRSIFARLLWPVSLGEAGLVLTHI